MESTDGVFQFQTLGLALVLGLLVGLQRERSDRSLAGLRTFPIITIFGTITAYLADSYGGWILAAGLVSVVGVVAIGNLSQRANGETGRGMTTEFAILLMYGVGAYLAEGMWSIAVVVGGGVAALLQFKPELHRLAGQLGDDDLKAFMRFVLISCVVLPVLPNEKFGPYQVWNPFEIWLMVVLIVGISLAGYIAYKFLGRRAGILLGGLLGGAISSTATTVSYARRTALQPGGESHAVLVIMLASAVVYVRVLVEIAAVAPTFAKVAWPPLLSLMLATTVPAVVLWFRVEHDHHPMPKQENPTELKSAIFFAAMYALVLYGLAAAKHYSAGEALYGVAWLSGVTTMDAITLSTSHMVAREQIDPTQGWKIIVVGSMSNLLAKAIIAGMIGGRRLALPILACFAVPVATAALLFLIF